MNITSTADNASIVSSVNYKKFMQICTDREWSASGESIFECWFICIFSEAGCVD